ncbi:MAG: helix-turn-helix transcriptional regulator [Clostridia bacterium]|nr:helix-turn-helix transcriptional regulator [Clostridia bacterium]
MENFRKMVAQNLITLRTAKGWTQAQLGEQINYSDKSISKWERGDGLPDAFVLKQLSELFGVTVDYLLTYHPEGEVHSDTIRENAAYSHRVITCIALLGVLGVALLAFIILWLMGNIVWETFIYAIPAAMVVWLVLNSIWGKPMANLYIISILGWSILLCVYLTFFDLNWWQLFLVGIPMELIIILCFNIKKRRE